MFENIEFLKDLSKEELTTLQLFCQERKISAWETLFLKGDEATSMYIVKSWTLVAEDNSSILWHIQSWEIVWEMALFWDHSKRSATVKALIDSSIIVILWFSMKELSQKHPDILNKIKEIIKSRNIKNNLLK